MPNTINYAEKWEPDLLEIFMQNSLISPFVTTNVRWVGAKTFHFTQATTSGFKSHNRAGGWNTGVYTQTDVPFSCDHDRDVEFLIDKADVDESNATADIKKISEVFEKTQATPDRSASFFAKVATKALTLNNYHSMSAHTDWTAANVYSKLKTMLGAGKLRRYKAMGKGALIVYVDSFIMDLLEQSTAFTRTIETTQIAEGGIGIETRVTSIDNAVIMEIIDDEVFYSAFNFDPTNGGFEPLKGIFALTEDSAIDATKTYYTKSGDLFTAVATPKVADIASYYEKSKDGGRKINVLIASPVTTKFVPKISSIYYFAPGAHTKGDAYLYQNRDLSGTFTFPNGKDNVVDSIYVDVDVAQHGAVSA